MKTNLKLLAGIAAFGLLFSSCQKDSGEPKEGPIEGKTGYAALTILDGSSTLTRAAGTDVEGATPQETGTPSSVNVYIFDSSNRLEYSGVLPVTAGVTDKFQITSGNKYFYIFFNLPTSFSASSIGTGTTRQVFENHVMNTVINASNRPDIALDNNFFIGTLWAEVTAVTGSGTDTTPENIELEIGRVTSKAQLKSIVGQIEASAGLPGTLTQPKYRMGSVPTKYYRVGHHVGTKPPGSYTSVESAVHNEAPTVSGSQNPVFVQYTWPTAPNTNIAPATGSEADYYIIENTTAPDGSGTIFYGNTTYVQFSLVYTPDPSIIHSASTGLVGGTLPGSGTFYAAESLTDGMTYIFDGVPSFADFATQYTSPAREYTNGVTYYKHPVMDSREVGVANQAVVLRNHYYEMNVSSISNLGDNTDYVDPEEPIKDKKDVTIEVKILPWSKITQDIQV